MKKYSEMTWKEKSEMDSEFAALCEDYERAQVAGTRLGSTDEEKAAYCAAIRSVEAFRAATGHPGFGNVWD